MPSLDLISCALWVSRLSPKSHLSVVKDIWQTLRQRNATLGLTGAVVFDGERFCELLEGSAADITAMYQALQDDPRHTELRMLHTSVTTSLRRLPQWRSGYCDATALDPFCEGGLQDEAAVSAFLDLLPHCELSP